METYHKQKKRESDFLTSPAIEDSLFLACNIFRKKWGEWKNTYMFTLDIVTAYLENILFK